jgi:hypothetical protein
MTRTFTRERKPKTPVQRARDAAQREAIDACVDDIMDAIQGRLALAAPFLLTRIVQGVVRRLGELLIQSIGGVDAGQLLIGQAARCFPSADAHLAVQRRDGDRLFMVPK